MRTFRGIPGLLLLLATPLVVAEDWPQWRGVDRRGIWTESGIVERFPAEGLARSWRVPIAEGYAGPAVSRGRVFVTDFVRGSGQKGTERALCLDEKTGRTLWTREWGVDYSGTEPRWASGPRATPTVDGNRVYVVGAMGLLSAFDLETGELAFRHDWVASYRASVPNWGVASAPLVEGDLLIALIGGPGGAAVVAFDKTTGEERWRAIEESGDPGYAPPLVVDVAGVRQVIVWHPKAIYSLEPATGKILWRQPFEVTMAMSVATPVFDANRLLVSAFFDGAMLLRLDTDRPAASPIWQRKGKSEQPADTRGLHALITTPVLDGDRIYGIDSYGELRALSAATGERIWESRELIGEHARWAAGLIVRNGDRYFVNTDRGDLVIARFSPDGYEEIDRTPLIEPTSGGGGRRDRGAVHWSHPAYANRHVVVRNDREILRASLSAAEAEKR